MIALPNSVRRQTLTVRCESVADAMALRTRMADFNRSHLLPVIERVLAEASLQNASVHGGARLQLKELKVDLGVFSENDLEALAPHRLHEALAQALRDAIRDLPVPQPGSGEEGWIALLEIYLLTGALPFWAPNTDSFSPGELFAELTAGQAGALASMFRRIGRDDQALNRVVLQFLPEQLRTLIRLLEPAQAALILAYLTDVTEADREERLADVTETEFARLSWLLVLTYLLQDPGSQFNRKVFVRSLVTGIADHAGVAYIDVLRILASGLQRMMRHAAVRSSLPAVIGELVDDAESTLGRSEKASLRIAATSGQAERVAGSQFETLRDLLFARLPLNRGPKSMEQLRHMASDRQALERIVARLLPEEFRVVVEMLEPDHAPVVLAYTGDVIAINRGEKQTVLNETDFELLLRQLVLSYLLREPGSQFNRKVFVNALIRGMADRTGVSFARILSLLGTGLEAVSTSQVLSSSLPGVIRELVQESAAAGSGPARPQATSEDNSLHESRSVLIQLLPALGDPRTPVAQALEAALS
ncbi:MAG TPA: contractile injection system tape measure protein, partial [Bryobacteraceae bacterium]|nr:contractile injection system tape measure protein [Bryobacteraceae bacterium]